MAPGDLKIGGVCRCSFEAREDPELELARSRSEGPEPK
jgi:hypothetical protein